MKKLCKIKSKDFNESKKYVLNFVKDPNYICKKCLRVSNTKEVLCKGEKI